MTQGTGKPLHAKLFLEGIEVPFIGATFTNGVGQTSIAYIDIPPLKEVMNIKPRTHILITTRDMNNPSQNYPFIKAWEGEVFGIQYSKTSDSRGFTISASDCSSYWDNVLLYFFNTQQSLGKGAGNLASAGLDFKDAERQGIGVQATTHSLSSYLLEILRSELGKDNADFLDALVGVYRKMQNVNSFYRTGEERLRISDRIRLRSSGQLNELLEAQESLEWISGIIGQSSGFSTLRQTVQKLMSLIFHDYVTVPFPGKVSVESESDLAGDPIKTGSKSIATQGEFLFKPNLYMLPPPACNIFYPDEYSSFSYSRMFFQEPTRLIYKPEMPSIFNSGANSVALEHVYEPQSFREFMEGAEQSELGDDALLTDTDPGKFNDPDADEKTKETNQGAKREFQFLSNEEKMRGILLSEETMMPSVTLFRSILDKDKRKKIGEGVARYLFFKKRFQTRSLTISSQLKLSVVPGFPCLIMDPQDATMSMVAYVESCTHRIYANQGGYTTVQLSYARTVDEQDTATNNIDEPPVPPWFDADIFGNSERDDANRLKYGEGISDFYGELLGSKGNQVITDLTKKETLTEATQTLIDEYLEVKRRGGNGSTSDLISRRTDREYVRLKEAFKFLGAETKSKDLTLPFLLFEGDRFSGNSGDDAKQVKLKRDTITKYRNALIKDRGFRG